MWIFPPRHRARAVPLLWLAGLGLAVTPAQAVVIPQGFATESVTPGATFQTPTAIAFLPDGRLLVAEKRGRLYTVRNGVKSATPLWNGSVEVLDNGDRGLLGLAVDPDYVHNRAIYLFYSVDPDSDGADGNNDAYSRLIRIQMSAADSTALDLSTRTVLLGATWSQGPPSGSDSHVCGALRFGKDGTLLASVGEGAQYGQMDPGGLDPDLFAPGRSNPLEDIGAFRAQYLGSLAGKILRLDPLTGDGLPSNPFWDGDPRSSRSRVWAYGFRNPFRFAVKPGTGSADPAAGQPGTLYVGDVGWRDFEEINVAPGSGINFGWPCVEGFEVRDDYAAATPPRAGCSTIGTPENPSAARAPIVALSHTDSGASIPPGAIANTAVGGCFYTGSFYPPEYHGRYFFADYGSNFIKTLTTDTSDQVVRLAELASDVGGPVDLVTDPVSGDIHWAAIFQGEVLRLRWLGGTAGNNAPQVIMIGAPTGGAPPLVTRFWSVFTYDLDGDPLSVLWTFGDGEASTLKNPYHTFTRPGLFPVVMTVDDGRGGIGRDTILVSVSPGGVFPSRALLDDFERADGAPGPGWGGDTSPLVIAGGALAPAVGRAVALWNTQPYSATQEAYFTLASGSEASPRQGVILKAQSIDPDPPRIEAYYNVGSVELAIEVFPAPGVSTVLASKSPILLAPGDQLGARTFPDGRVDVFVNGQLQLSSVVNNPLFASGGYIGVTTEDAEGARFDDFGGGNAVANTPPTAAIVALTDSSFYAADDTLRLTGVMSDAEDAPAALLSHWSIRLIHNNHFHPVVDLDTSSVTFVTDDHDDGTGVYYLLRYWVTDPGGLRDTALVRLFPENDLEPGMITVIPSTPHIQLPVRYSFPLVNHGRLPARISRWSLFADDTQIAQGDTLVGALDTVTVSVERPPLTRVGPVTIRLIADALGQVVETDETNNTSTREVVVVGGSVGSTEQPLAFALSNAAPNPTHSGVRWTLDLPMRSEVALQIHDVQGRRVWSERGRTLEAGRHTLTWPGRTTRGGRVSPGLYLATLEAGGRTFVQRVAVVQ